MSSDILLDDEGQKQLIHEARLGEPRYEIQECNETSCTVLIFNEMDVEVLLSPEFTVREWTVQITVQ